MLEPKFKCGCLGILSRLCGLRITLSTVDVNNTEHLWLLSVLLLLWWEVWQIMQQQLSENANRAYFPRTQDLNGQDHCLEVHHGVTSRRTLQLRRASRLDKNRVFERPYHQRSAAKCSMLL